jgi:hypothetical protein
MSHYFRGVADHHKQQSMPYISEDVHVYQIYSYIPTCSPGFAFPGNFCDVFLSRFLYFHVPEDDLFQLVRIVLQEDGSQDPYATLALLTSPVGGFLKDLLADRVV